MRDLIEKWYSNGRSVLIDIYDSKMILYGEDKIKIRNFSDLADIYLQIKKKIINNERKKIEGIIKGVESHTMTFLEGYSDLAMDMFAKEGYILFNFEKRRNGYIITERSMWRGIAPSEIMFKIPSILDREKKNVVVIENINYLIDFWGIERVITFFHTLLSRSDRFRYIVTGRMNEFINTFFERRIKLENGVFLTPGGGIYIAEHSVKVPHIYLRFGNGNVYIGNKTYLYGRINFEVYDYLKKHRDKNIIIDGFYNLEHSLGNEARIWLKAVMDLVYPNSVILLRYGDGYFVKGRIYGNIEDFKFLRYPVIFADVHKLTSEKLKVIEEIIEESIPIIITYDSFELVNSGNMKFIKQIERLKNRVLYIRL